MNIISPLLIASKAAKADLLKKFGIANLTGQEDGNLPIWRQTSSTTSATHVTDTGAAVLEPGPLSDKHLSRVKNHAAIIRTIAKASGFRDSAFVAAFLCDVVFWHHQSRNGRWNVVTGRYDRWAVKPVRDKHPEQKPTIDWVSLRDLKPSERTFHSIKDWAVEAGLIEAKSAKHMGKTKLWIKPTDKLSRAIFEAGFWDTLRGEFATPLATPVEQEKKAAPRGLSAKHKAIVDDHAALYRKTVTEQQASLTDHDRWEIWHKLTKPSDLTKTRQVAPFAPKDSYRGRKLWDALGLQWS